MSDIVRLPESRAILDTELIGTIVNTKLNEYAVILKNLGNAPLATGVDLDVLIEHLKAKGQFTDLVAPPKIAT